MAFSSDAAFEFKTSFTDRIKNANSGSDGQTDSDTKTPSIDADNFKEKWAVDPQAFKSNWVDSVASQQPKEVNTGDNQVTQVDNGAQQVPAQQTKEDTRPQTTSSGEGFDNRGGITFEKSNITYENSEHFFGHEDYEANKRKGYSNREIKDYLTRNSHLLRGDNRIGKGNLYDKIGSGGAWGSMDDPGSRPPGQSGSGSGSGSSPAQQSSNNAAAITAQDMRGPAQSGFDKAKWGYNAGSAPKYEDHDTNVRNRVAGLDYSVQQDRNYWSAKADKTRGETFGDVWKMETPNWRRWDDPEEISPSWNSGDKDKDKDK